MLLVRLLPQGTILADLRACQNKTYASCRTLVAKQLPMCILNYSAFKNIIYVSNVQVQALKDSTFNIPSDPTSYIVNYN